MSIFTRTLGPVNQFPVDSSGGGGSSMSITNNTPGALLMATGESNRIEGVSDLKYFTSSAGGVLSASTDVYVSGSGNYLYLNGLDSDGNLTKIKISIEGGVFKVEPTTLSD